MTKSTKNGKAIYNFLDTGRDNVEISFRHDKVLNENLLKIEMPTDWSCECECVTDLFINQATAKDLIKVLQEFAETGELK